MSIRVAALDHVQLAMPSDCEAEAEAFYCDVLGFTLLPKPEPFASRGGRWFVSGLFRYISAWNRISGQPTKLTLRARKVGQVGAACSAHRPTTPRPAAEEASPADLDA